MILENCFSMPRERERALWDPVKKAFGDKGSPSRELKGFTCWGKKKNKKKTKKKSRWVGRISMKRDKIELLLLLGFLFEAVHI